MNSNQIYLYHNTHFSFTENHDVNVFGAVKSINRIIRIKVT